jgi:hypothetical protein
MKGGERNERNSEKSSYQLGDYWFRYCGFDIWVQTWLILIEGEVYDITSP